MSDYIELDEQVIESIKASRRARAAYYNAGVRGFDGLTDRERDLLVSVRSAGFEIATGRLYNGRMGVSWEHGRAVGRAS